MRRLWRSSSLIRDSASMQKQWHAGSSAVKRRIGVRSLAHAPRALRRCSLSRGLGRRRLHAAARVSRPSPRRRTRGRSPRRSRVTWTTRLDRDHRSSGESGACGRAASSTRRRCSRRSVATCCSARSTTTPITTRSRHACSARWSTRAGSPSWRSRCSTATTSPRSMRRAATTRATRRTLRRAVSWDKSGWPPWTDYAPIAQIALDAGLPIVATGLPRSRMRALMKPPARRAGDGGAPAAEPLDEGTPLTPEQEASLRDELRESHCGHLPDSGSAPCSASSARATPRWRPRSSPPPMPRTRTTPSWWPAPDTPDATGVRAATSSRETRSDRS